MKRRLAAVVLALSLPACSDRPGDFEEVVVPVYDHGAGLPHFKRFGAEMTGDQEIPPRTTDAIGRATFRYENGVGIIFTVNVRGGRNITQAHIHNAPADSNGAIVAWLYPDAPPQDTIEGRFKGVLASDTIVDSEVIGPLAGQGVVGLMRQIRLERTYVNVHTTQYPTGEIRGQILH